MVWRINPASVSAVMACLVVSQPAGAQALGGAPRAPVKLVSSVTAVAPGGSFDLALAYDLANEWHIYWKNPGDSGAPPIAKWDLPPGFAVGELRFPTPRRYESGPADFRLVTYVLDGKPALLVRITAPEDLEVGSQVTLAASVTTLVCKDACLVETQQVSVKLSVVADAVKPANEKLFQAAQKEIPPAGGKGKYITVSARPSVDSVEVGGSFDVEVTIHIKPKHKIQSNKPGAFFIPTEVLLEPSAGVGLGEFVYPKPKEKIDKALKIKLSTYAGKPVVKVPIKKVTKEARGDRLKLSGIVIAQACQAREGGQCFPPEAVAWSTSVRLVGAQAATHFVLPRFPGKGPRPPPAHRPDAGPRPGWFDWPFVKRHRRCCRPGQHPAGRNPGPGAGRRWSGGAG